MITLPGYQINETIYEGATGILYRGVRLQDQQAVIVKPMQSAYAAGVNLARLRREYEITKTLDIPGVVNVCGLEQDEHDLALVLIDDGGFPLDKLIATEALDLPAFLKIAIQLAHILGQIHERNIIHKDIKPANLFYHPATQQVKMTNFSIASRLSQENQRISNPAMLEGTLAYMSPEQTGRMNRDIDYRTDFYSLGVTFYELLTGQLPFQATDPMELVHAHLAKQPRAPSELDPSRPPMLSAIVMKLLAKTAEERYQSAYGLKADLETCWVQWQTSSSIPNFVLGQHAHSDRFQIPQKLYGREQEIEILLAAFERISRPLSTDPSMSGGKRGAELMLVSGYSGSGKSALVNEIHKPIVRQKGYFVSGKFDQFQRNIPYRALIQAFQELVRQILTESEQRIALWQARLTNALGAAGQVIVEVIPEAELIIGPQPPLPLLPPTEAQNRFNLVFTRFIQAFTNQEHPLVIFLDDLQWADSATLRLLQTLLTNATIDYLLLIGAYRDNEVTASHPLMLTLTEMGNAGIRIGQITVDPLDLVHLNHLIVDTLHCDDGAALPLAQLVLQKTAGNPFFVRQFLMSLYQEKLVWFEPSNGQWRFDLKRIESMGMTDNVVTLMTGKIQKLSTETQRALKLAACIGNRFDLGTLAVVNEKAWMQTAADLWSAIQERLILPISTMDEFAQPSDAGVYRIVYRFLHDRIQQAAYGLILPDQRKVVHLQVGQLMLANSNEAERDERIFDIVNHLNLGQELLIEQNARHELARLNLAAGRKAKASAAYKPALSYFQAGQILLSESSWSVDYDLAFALTIELAECGFLCAQYEAAERDYKLLLQKAQSRLDKAKVYDLQVHQYETLTRYAEAIAVGHAALALFDVAFPQKAEEKEAALAAELAAIKAQVGDQPIDALLDLPVLYDPEGQMVMKLLSNLHTSCYLVGDKTLTLLNTARMVSRSLRYGHTPESAHGYVLHAMNIGPIEEEYKSAYEFGLLALRLNERLPHPGLRAKILMNFSWAISIWRKPFADSFVYSQEAFRLGNENGFFSDAGFALFNDTYQSLFMGSDLGAVQQRCELAVDYLSRTMAGFVDAPQTIRQWVCALQGLTQDPTSLTDGNEKGVYAEENYRRTHQGHTLFEMFYFIAKLALLYTFQEYRAACEIAEQAERVIRDYTGTIWDALRVFYHALALAALYRTFPPEQQQRAWQTMSALRARMQVWADNCPENFLNHALLIVAEMARIEGQANEAMNAYEQAIQVAREQGLVHDEALANELYARFWLARQNEKIARLYMVEAALCYERWGATVKVKELKQKHPRLFIQTSGAAAAGVDPYMATTTTAALDLDFAAAMKAAQAISREITLDTLLENLLRIVMATAGAQKGFLILEKDQQWQIEAAGTVDPDIITIRRTQLDESSHILSVAIVNYVKRTGENVVIAEATQDSQWANDPYVIQAKPQSILCTLIRNHGKAVGILYLENNLVTHAFTPDRIAMIQLLSAQAAISLENAGLYEETKLEVAERRRAEASLRQNERQLRHLNEQLEEHSRTLEQKVSERTHEIEQRRRVAESLRHLLTILNSNLPLADILTHIVAEASRLLVSDMSVIYKLEDAERGVFRIQTAQGALVDHLVKDDFPAELTEAMLQGQFVAVTDITNAFPLKPALAPQTSVQMSVTASHLTEHYQALLALPLTITGETYGCLLLCYAEPQHFSDEEMDLVRAFRDQAVLAIENARLRQRVEQAAVAEERGRLARELHDSVTQSLYSLTLLAAGWQRLLRAGRLESLEEPLEELGKIGQQALKEMRLLVHELRPPDLEKVGLLGALHQRLAAVEKRAGINVRFVTEETMELPISVEEGLYRIAQEALNNAVKHAAATSVIVDLHSDAEATILEITDNGAGFDPAALRDRGGIGLTSMRERAEKLGGCLTITSAPGQGTTVRVTLAGRLSLA